MFTALASLLTNKPKRNEKDLPGIPQEVKDTLKFHFVENVDQVLAIPTHNCA